MKMIIISPYGSRLEFNYDQLAEFHDELFVWLAGIPKRVELEIDAKTFDEIYWIHYD